MMTSLSNWGRWGKQDELGALNLITPQKRKSAAAEVKEGMAISMARNAIKVATEGSPAFEHRMITTGQDPKSTGASDAYSAQYHGYTLTHMDALCHLFYKGKMYNGFSQQEVTDKGAGKLSVINTKDGLFTRAVLMDMPRLTGLKFLKGQTAIYGLWSALPLPTALTGLYGLAAPCFFRWNGRSAIRNHGGSRNCITSSGNTLFAACSASRNRSVPRIFVLRSGKAPQNTPTKYPRRSCLRCCASSIVPGSSLPASYSV